MPVVAADAVDGEFDGLLRGSITPAPRTPDTQQVVANRGITRDLSQQTPLPVSVAG